MDPKPQRQATSPYSNRQKLLDSALYCVTEHGTAGTTIEMIRKRAGSSIGSLYHHFGNKQNLLAALFFELLDAQLAWSKAALEQADTIEDVISAFVHGYVGWVSHHPTEARFLYAVRSEVAAGSQAELLRQRNKARFGQLHTLLKAGIEAGHVRALPKEIYASLLLGQSENYCRAWLSHRVSSKPSAHAALLADAAWRAIKA